MLKSKGRCRHDAINHTTIENTPTSNRPNSINLIDEKKLLLIVRLEQSAEGLGLGIPGTYLGLSGVGALGSVPSSNHSQSYSSS